MESVLDVIHFAGTAQGPLLSLVLFSMKRGNITANHILAILLFSYSFLYFFHAAGHDHTQHLTLGKLRWLIHGFMSVIAPQLFFYTKASTE